ncbi:response regulator [Xanthobacter versatilis]|uniref:Two component transcriptional regulator, winged helix family n=1 Tax=Xanthobacter autotrophicus (strain ATCC BAA-1158 / Py2) TaxID=78245 RepID=A7IET6_XANP2|nr:two component transcriptional regulator, winged helix family [Xanthobacter autotrophicus Py2]
MRILLVEDNERMSALAADALRTAGFAVDAVHAAADAEEAVSTTPFDAIILDLGLPDRDGMDLLDTLRRKGVAQPILVLTARDGAPSVIAGLNGGADDYMRKPFNVDELIARVRALLRRPGSALGVSLKEGNVELDTIARQARVDGVGLDLSRKEAAALELLMRRTGAVISKPALEETLYGYGEEVSSNAVEVLIHRLRKKLAGAGAVVEIHTLRGIGYLLSGARP